MIEHVNNVSFLRIARLSTFNIWVMNHRRTHLHVRVHRTRLFSYIVIHPQTGARKETVAHTLLKNSCTCVGVSYAWTAWNSNWAQERTTFVKHVRQLDTVVKSNERSMKVNFTKKRGKDTHLFIRMHQLLVCKM